MDGTKRTLSKKERKSGKKTGKFIGGTKEKMAYEKAEEGIETKEQICLIKIEELEKKQKEIWQLWKEERELDRIQKAEKKLQEDYEKEREIWKEQNGKISRDTESFFWKSGKASWQRNWKNRSHVPYVVPHITHIRQRPYIVL